MIRSGDHRDIAIFTVVQEEPEFIHPWINHYKKHVADPGDLHVLVHAPTPAEPQSARSEAALAWQQAEALMTSHHSITRLPVHHASSFDHDWLTDTVSRFQTFLLQSYEWVLFAEIDEFVLPTPQQSGPRTLLDLVRDLGVQPAPAVRARGFEIVQQDGEQPVPPALYADGTNVHLSVRQLVAERRYWYSSRMYSKTLLANVPLRWSRGFHLVEGSAKDVAEAEASPSLTLLHLHRADFDLALRRLRRSRARRWSQLDVDRRYGWQNRADEEEFRVFWTTDSDTGKPMAQDRMTLIPSGYHESLS
jgi:hypothetical protein